MTEGQELVQQQAAPPAIKQADPVAVVQANVAVVQKVMKAIMKKDTHYGAVPGTDKPTLLQPGAEAICLAFGWATRYEVEDLSYTDVVRYRITCKLYDRNTGELVGEGIGEASSDEEKYRWRKAVCTEEYEATPEDRKRVAYKRGKGGSHYTVEQIRQEPADIANTVLKMGSKRAHIAATKTASGCSDMFVQDLGDLPEAVVGAITGADETPPEPIGPKNWLKLCKGGDRYGYTPEDILATAAVLGHQGAGPDLDEQMADKLWKAMQANPKNPAAEEEGQGA